MGTERHDTNKCSTLEKAEQLLVLLKHDSNLMAQLKNPSTRDEVLAEVGLTEGELRDLKELVNQQYDQTGETLLLAGW